MSQQPRPIVIRNGRVIDPSQGIDTIADVVVMGGVVVGIDSPGATQLSDGWIEFDASDKIVAPGFIDLHTHLRTPGQEWKEDPKTASDAAARGGFTTICAMPNTYPAQDNASVVGELMQRCASESTVRVRPIGAITKGRKGHELAPMHELADAGAVGFSDDGDPVMSPHLMRQALAYSSDLDLPIINHAEDRGLVSEWDMNEGVVATHLGLRGIPNSAESMMIARDIELARIANGRLHVPHVSTAESVRLIRRARDASINVTAEVTPHHLALTEHWVYGENGNVPSALHPNAYDTNSKMAPPTTIRRGPRSLNRGFSRRNHRRDWHRPCPARRHRQGLHLYRSGERHYRTRDCSSVNHRHGGDQLEPRDQTANCRSQRNTRRHYHRHAQTRCKSRRDHHRP